MWVRDLRRSEDFYRELLRLEVFVRGIDTVGLATPEGQQLLLRAGPTAARVVGHVGVQRLVWAARDMDDLARCEELLKARRTHTTTTVVDETTLVEGLDPDHVPVIVIFPGPDEVPMRAVPSHIYAAY
jgi:hypothetical protein